MIQATVTTPAVKSKTCSTCPNFKNFDEPSRRGWCGLFDQQAREHHEQTNDCVLNSDVPISHKLEDNLALFSDVDADPFPSEEIENEADQPYSEYEVGSVVKVIDPDEDHTEWAVFEIIERKYNKYIHNRNNPEAYLNHIDWFFRLASNNDSTTINKSLWVAENEICSFDMSQNVCTVDIF